MLDDESSLLASVRRWSASDAEISFRDFEKLRVPVNAELGPDLSAKELSEIVELALKQSARWETRWLFSASASPDVTAAEEWKGWEDFYSTFLDWLVERVPSAGREPANKFHQSVLLHRLILRG